MTHEKGGAFRAPGDLLSELDEFREFAAPNQSVRIAT
jgi:hypothetical protein